MKETSNPNRWGEDLNQFYFWFERLGGADWEVVEPKGASPVNSLPIPSYRPNLLVNQPKEAERLVDNKRNAVWIKHHAEKRFPNAKKIFVFATGSLRKALFLYWELVAREENISLEEALKFVPPVIKAHAPDFESQALVGAINSLGMLGLQSYVEAQIRNGDSKVRTPIFLGEVSGQPVYVMPTDGETTSNASAEAEARNKAAAALAGFQALDTEAEFIQKLVVMAADTVSEGERQVAEEVIEVLKPTGKPINTEEGKLLAQALKDTEDSVGRQELINLFSRWYLAKRYLRESASCKLPPWSDFLEGKATEDDIIEFVENRKSEIIEETELVLRHINSLVVGLGKAGIVQVVAFALEVKLALAAFADEIKQFIAYLESGGGGMFQQFAFAAEELVHKLALGLKGEVKVDGDRGVVFAAGQLEDYFKDLVRENRQEASDVVGDLYLIFHIMGTPIPAMLGIIEKTANEN